VFLAIAAINLNPASPYTLRNQKNYSSEPKRGPGLVWNHDHMTGFDKAIIYSSLWNF
jgi:hypothetical protein